MYHATPFVWCVLSPSELLIRGSDKLIPEWKFISVSESTEDQKHNCNHRHGVRRVSSLPPVSEVWIVSGDHPESGTVLAPGQLSVTHLGFTL